MCSSGAMPRHPLGEFMALPEPLQSDWERYTPSPSPLPAPSNSASQTLGASDWSHFLILKSRPVCYQFLPVSAAHAAGQYTCRVARSDLRWRRPDPPAASGRWLTAADWQLIDPSAAPASLLSPFSTPQCTGWTRKKTRKPSWRKDYVRVACCHSKMAVSRHLGYYRTGNSAIRSADPKNPCLEPDMEWIGCTVCEIFAFTLYRDLETRVQGHSRSSKVAPFDRAHTTSYSSSIVTILYLVPFPRYSRILVENCYPPCIWRRRWGWSHQIYGTTLGVDKLEWWWKNFDDTFSRFDTIHACDGWTDGQTELAWHIRAIAHMLSRVKTAQSRTHHHIFLWSENYV